MNNSNHKQQILKFWFEWILVILIMLIFISIAVVFNCMSWMGSHTFLKKYINDSTIYAASIMIFPSITLYLTFIGITKIYRALKKRITHQLAGKEEDL